jgi:predicted transcriptional regulator
MVKTRKTQKQKDERRQATIYLPVDVLKRVKIFGITVDREMSEIIADAVTEYLDRHNAPPAPGQ